MINHDIPDAPTDPLLQLIHGGWTSQVICTAAELGLADYLSEGPQTLRQLATSAQCDTPSLERLLRALLSLGIVTLTPDGQYAATVLGLRLRQNASDSLNAQARWFGQHSWRLWGELTESVRTGVSARARQSGKEGYADFEDSPDAAQLFNRAMCELTHVVALSMVDAYDFSQAGRLVDVGGGHGELLIPILQANRHARGTVVDLRHALDGAQRHLAVAGLADRIDVIEGDFFAALPGDGDIYLLKAILHNWDDRRCELILATLHRSMPVRSKLLIIERVVPDVIDMNPQRQAVCRSDLNMLVGRGGRERTRAEYTSLLERSGFSTPELIHLVEGFSAIETERTS